MSTDPLSVAVLVSAGRHPVTGTPRACPGDAVALAFARTLASKPLAVCHAGQPDEPALADYFALGAEKIFVVPVTRDSDAAAALAAHLKDFDVIITGTHSEHGASSGLFPYRIAHALNRPLVANAMVPSPPGERVGVRGWALARHHITAALPAGSTKESRKREQKSPPPHPAPIFGLETLPMGAGLSSRGEANAAEFSASVTGTRSSPVNGELLVTQYLPKGQRRTIAVTLPAVVTVHPSARVDLRYAHARIASGHIETTAAATVKSAPNAVQWQAEPRPRPPQPLRAARALDAHDRMMTYLETPARRGVVVSEETSVDKAQILLNYLREHRLIGL